MNPLLGVRRSRTGKQCTVHGSRANCVHAPQLVADFSGVRLVLRLSARIRARSFLFESTQEENIVFQMDELVHIRLEIAKLFVWRTIALAGKALDTVPQRFGSPIMCRGQFCRNYLREFNLAQRRCFSTTAQSSRRWSVCCALTLLTSWRRPLGQAISIRSAFVALPRPKCNVVACCERYDP